MHGGTNCGSKNESCDISIQYYTTARCVDWPCTDVVSSRRRPLPHSHDIPEITAYAVLNGRIHNSIASSSSIISETAEFRLNRHHCVCAHVNSRNHLIKTV